MLWYNIMWQPFLWKCLYQIRAIAVFPVFRLLTDFVCLLNYELCLSLWKIARCSVILLLPLFVNNISAISWWSVLFFGGNRSTRWNLLNCRKSLTNFITYCCIKYSSLWDKHDMIKYVFRTKFDIFRLKQAWYH